MLGLHKTGQISLFSIVFGSSASGLSRGKWQGSGSCPVAAKDGEEGAGSLEHGDWPKGLALVGGPHGANLTKNVSSFDIFLSVCPSGPIITWERCPSPQPVALTH